MITYTTNWISDIEITDKLARTLAERMSEAVEDALYQIATDIAIEYIPAPEDADEHAVDRFEDQVVNPLYDHLLKQVISHLLPRD